jgi:hypothetical protein
MNWAPKHGLGALRWAILIVLAFVPSVARPDGGVVRAKETHGSFIITIFSPPYASATTPTDVTVLVQRQSSCVVVLNADVTLGFVSPTVEGGKPAFGTIDVVCGRATSLEVTNARRSQANKLLYGASVILPRPGSWRLWVTVREGGEEAKIACSLPIGSSSGQMTALWPYLALPPVVIALFALNLWLRSHQRNTGYEAEMRKTSDEAQIREIGRRSLNQLVVRND